MNCVNSAKRNRVSWAEVGRLNSPVSSSLRSTVKKISQSVLWQFFSYRNGIMRVLYSCKSSSINFNVVHDDGRTTSCGESIITIFAHVNEIWITKTKQNKRKTKQTQEVESGSVPPN